MACLFPHSEHCDLKIFIYYYSGRKKQKLYMDKFNIHMKNKLIRTAKPSQVKLMKI